MKPELIIMLTNHDRTVPDALEVFWEARSLPVQHWGFKDIGLPVPELIKLVQEMKKAGKITCLEVVSLSEDAGLKAAKLAMECGIDMVLGTVYTKSIHQHLKKSHIKYFPFVGKVSGHPSVLEGSIAGIIQQIEALKTCGIDGFDLLTYRYTGNPTELLHHTVPAAQPLPLISAGSIDSFSRIEEVRTNGAWGFTIGSAFFEQKFIPNGSFFDNIKAVVDWLKK
ncbi:hypothetical protein JW964_22715 [candidate division KSB1 bacterium]|nr:hypothetical protein [candidate division KSB1 bacterium]